MIFTIDNDNNVIAHETAPATQDGMVCFASQKEFTAATAEWPISRLVEVWNSFAGVAPFTDCKPVKKFTDRATAANRIWTAIQRLAKPHAEAKAAAETNKADKPTAAKGRKPAPKPKATKGKKTAAGKPREGTNKAQVIALIQRKGGATLDEIIKTTGWQKHTVRGFISILGSKSGIKVTSTRRESDGARVYEA